MAEKEDPDSTKRIRAFARQLMYQRFRNYIWTTTIPADPDNYEEYEEYVDGLAAEELESFMTNFSIDERHAIGKNSISHILLSDLDPNECGQA